MGNGIRKRLISFRRECGRERVYESDADRVNAWRKRELGTLEELQIRTYNLTMEDAIALQSVVSWTGENANQIVGRPLVEAAKRVGTDLT